MPYRAGTLQLSAATMLHITWMRKNRGEAICERHRRDSRIETFLPAVLTECRRRGVSEQTFVRVAAETPANLFGLSGRKGAIAPGFDADLVIVNDGVDEVIDSTKFLSKAKYSPFHGRRVSARVDLTMVRGQTVVATAWSTTSRRPAVSCARGGHSG